MNAETEATGLEREAPYALNVTSLRIGATAAQEVVLPPYAGSTLRGAFGHALRLAGCRCRESGHICTTMCVENEQALLLDVPTRCAYGYLFDTPRPPGTPLLERQTEVPHPYVLRPPLGGGKTLAPGEHVEFEVQLVGLAIACLPVVIEACVLMCRAGLGAGRGVLAVDQMWEQAPFGPERRLLPFTSGPAALTLTAGWPVAQALAATLSSQRVTVQFLTPTRLIHEGSLAQRPEFDILMRAVLRRLTLLSLFHGGDSSPARFTTLALQAKTAARLVAWQGGWHDWQRYSSRQNRKITLGGLVGEAVYEGDLAPFLPFLVFGQAVHVGKSCSFGSGHYQVQ